jgi:hypothetical protein
MLLLGLNGQNGPFTKRVRLIRDHKGTRALDDDIEFVLRMLRLIVVASRCENDDRHRPMLKKRFIPNAFRPFGRRRKRQLRECSF